MKDQILINISNRHLHLTEEHISALFGQGYNLTKKNDVIQPGQFACEETVELAGPKGSIERVRIIGPARKATQIELLVGDTYKLGVPAVIKHSGDIEGTPGIKIIGPVGEIEIDKGVIIAARHIHLHTSQAPDFGLKDKDIVKVRIDGPRAIVFENVLVRVADSCEFEMHIDTEEANAGLIRNGTYGTIIK